jgi:hypothetical protein
VQEFTTMLPGVERVMQPLVHTSACRRLAGSQSISASIRALVKPTAPRPRRPARRFRKADEFMVAMVILDDFRNCSFIFFILLCFRRQAPEFVVGFKKAGPDAFDGFYIKTRSHSHEQEIAN